MESDPEEMVGIARQRHYGHRLCWPVEVILDMGANLGQGTTACRWFFPEARVYCFEPNRNLWPKLKPRFEGQPQVVLNEMALSYSRGEALGFL